MSQDKEPRSRFRPRGARGVVLLGFGFMSALMGVAYAGGPWLGNLAVWPPVSRGLFALDLVGGIRLWGCLWLVVSAVLLRAAFRREQAMAMAVFSFMVAIWCLNYCFAFARDLLTTGHSALWLTAAVYAAFLVTSIGVSRMLNAPPLHMDAILRRLRELEAERG